MLLLGEGFARKPNNLPMRADIVVRESKEKMDSSVEPCMEFPGAMLVEMLPCRTDEDLAIRTSLAPVVAPTVVLERDVEILL